MKRRLSFMCLFAALAVCSDAQIATTTSLVGTLTDASGKTVPGARVTATNTGTHDVYRAVTSEQGYYNIQFVAVGDYEIQVEQPGFQTVRVSGIHVDINQVVRNDITLKIGNVVESVTVQASTPAIKTDDATVSEVISTRQVAELPLSFRDPMQFALMTPGVLQGGNSLTGVPPGENFIGAGTRSISSDMTLDGVSIMNNLITTTPTRPIVDAVAEVEVQTGTYTAQYGAYMGVHINSITKSGTNEPHGNLWEFIRNQKFDARSFFTLPTPANPTAAKPPLRQNQFGVEFDGPVYLPKIYNGKNKTFFMASYEGLRLVQSSTSLSTSMPAAFFTGKFPRSDAPSSRIPSMAMRHSRATSFRRTVFHPLCSSCSSITQLPICRAWPAIFRCRCRPGSPPTRPWTVSTRTSATKSAFMCGPIIRTSRRSADLHIPVNGSTTPTTTTNYTVGYTHTLTSNLVNDLRLGRYYFNSATVNPFSVSNDTTAGTNLGIPGFDFDSTSNNPGIPDFNVTGFNGLNESGTNWYQNDSTNQLSEQLSWNHGAHNVMAGLAFSRLATGRAAVNSARGGFTFNGTITGYAPADFILGTPQSFTTPGPEVRGRVAEWRDGFFVQDKWQVSRKLTLNYGLRYELPTVPYTINGVATELNENQTALVGGTPGFRFIAPNHNDWAPRLGFAYRINDKTVFRGGAGIYYNPNQTNSYTFLNTNPPYTTILSCTYTVGSGQQIPTLANPITPGVCPGSGHGGHHRNSSLASADAAHEPMECGPGTATLERRRH